MSKEQLKAFLEKVKVDSSLNEKLLAAVDIEAAVAIARDAGFSISADDITTQRDTTDTSTTEYELEVARGAGKGYLNPNFLGKTHTMETADSGCGRRTDTGCRYC